ncbi:MAG TPA: M20/M25/M40 family metallo-hydrolase [Burkholderiales bacterium]|nr:M20/M25/M40 family metallo-hydrolase [Burkholderiales bacterium]
MEQAALVDLACRLVRFPSPQTDRMEFEPEVQAFIGSCVAPMLEEWGLPIRRDRMGSLICELGPADAASSVLMMTYAMTHPAATMRDPFAGEVITTPQGPAVRGRGIAEQKGALAAALTVLKQLLRRTDLKRRLVFVLSSAGETGRHDAAREIFSALRVRPTLGVVAIGSNGRVALGNKGRIDIEIEIGGTASHSSTPWAGVNAIDGAFSVLAVLKSLALDRISHPALGKSTLTSTSIESWPKATHTIQNRVRLVLDRRLLPGEDPDAAFAEIDQLVKSACASAPWKIDVRRGPFMYPCVIPDEGAFLRHVRAGHAAQGLPAPETFYSHGALDAGFLVHQGCEASMWGPGRMELFHTEDESLLIDELVTGAKAYLGFLQSALTAV